MKDLQFEYKMNLSFTPPVANHRFTLKCIPLSNERQELSDVEVEVFPKEFLSTDDDSFGNRCIYGHAQQPHDHFSVLVTGRARTGLASYETGGAKHLVGMYRYQTDYTRPGEKICAFARDLQKDRDKKNAGVSLALICASANNISSLDVAANYMHALHEHFIYKQGVTNISTTAEEAFALGAGVCQDFSHILISLCRIHRIPSRYVVGMLIGEGLSHAWVEIWENGKWIALDPTNDLIVDDQHIKISTGRDYKDCTINQGVFYGQTTQKQTISVSVREV